MSLGTGGALASPADGDTDEVYLGAMSGTSLDGVDAVSVRFAPDGGLAVQGHVHRPFSNALRAELLALNQRGGADELHRAQLAAHGVAQAYADTIDALLKACPPASRPLAVGAHGQTVRHQPDGQVDAVGPAAATDGWPVAGYTVQLLNGAQLAERCGLDVVCDFRSRDVAAGGQGAPLVPAFHARCFGTPGQAWAALNLGGIGNLTLGTAEGVVTGFDCGPGNALLDLWCERHRGEPFDQDGAWGAGGQVLPDLLAALMAEPYLWLPPPKSTGRDLFHADWLAERLRAGRAEQAAPIDVQATLAAFTAQAATDALRRHSRGTGRLLVCGGGALNGDLMRRLAAGLPGVDVVPSDAAGLPPLQVEATAFAWLARAFIRREPGNLEAVTGARGPRVLGALYPA